MIRIIITKKKLTEFNRLEEKQQQFRTIKKMNEKNAKREEETSETFDTKRCRKLPSITALEFITGGE